MAEQTTASTDKDIFSHMLFGNMCGSYYHLDLMGQ